MLSIFIAFLAFVAILVGGLVALKLKDKFHLILGFSAGAVLGVAFFDLIPESFELGGEFFEAHTLAFFMALGFVGYLILDRLIFYRTHHHTDDCEHGHAPAQERGVLGALSLATHSFLDGAAIGLAFQVSLEVGIIVSVAVITHGFSDGINTVGFILKNGGKRITAIKFLILDAIAPMLGAASTLFFVLPEQYLGPILAVFAGFFVYMGASDLIPESHHAHPKLLTTIMTLFGMAVLYVAISIAHV